MASVIISSRILNCKLYRHYHSLIGKSLIRPCDLENKEYKSLLWTAIELKELHERKELHVDVLKDKLVFLQTTTDDIWCVPLAAACNILHTTLYKLVKTQWELEPNLDGHRKFLEANVDIHFCQCNRASNVIKMAKRSKIPVVIIKCPRYAIISVLADMMTLQLHFGKLQGIVLSWFGPPGNFINTYMEIATRLGVEVRYCCSCQPDKGITPLVTHEALHDEQRHAKLEEIIDYRRIDKKTHVVVLNLSEDNQFNLESLIKNTEDNWIFIQKPFNNEAVDKILLENCIVPNDSCNYKYIFAAIILRFLNDYHHRTSMPKFE